MKAENKALTEAQRERMMSNDVQLKEVRLRLDTCIYLLQ